MNVTLLNLMGMALDHFIAIIRPLHYPTLMSGRRANATIVAFWVVALVLGKKWSHTVITEKVCMFEMYVA